jgi:hypothetical protein
MFLLCYSWELSDYCVCPPYYHLADFVAFSVDEIRCYGLLFSDVSHLLAEISHR